MSDAIPEGWHYCQACRNWHAAEYDCAAARAREQSGAGAGAGADAPEPRYHCVECYRTIMLDDVAHDVRTRSGRALCLSCSARLNAR
jgi:hypothetical protein